MPLIQSKSKKAFSENVGKEMESGKPQKQALAIAYSVKRKNAKKKMAEGGEISASNEKRPMPEQKANDTKMVSQNSSKKDNAQSGWTDQPTVKQSTKPSITPLARPKFVNGAFKVKDRADVEKEEHLQSALPPSSPKDQPAQEYNEDRPDRQGPSTPSLKMKKMANGGVVSFKDSEEDNVEHPAGLESDNDQMKPSEDEYMANHFANGGDVRDEEMVSRPDKGWGAIIVKGKAEGGMIDSDDQPEPEADMEHHDSITAAIMARRNRLHAEIDSGAHDEDAAAMYAEGGEIHSHPSIYSDDSDQADLSRNADEDANEEDQLSFNALRKENYSESEGLKQLDQPEDSNEHGHEIDSDRHDMISQIRSKMNKQRQFKVK